MSRKEEIEATEKMRMMSKEEMMKVDPSEYYGENDRVNWITKVEEHANIPVPILETEDDDFIEEYVKYWYDMDLLEESIH